MLKKPGRGGNVAQTGAVETPKVALKKSEEKSKLQIPLGENNAQLTGPETGDAPPTVGRPKQEKTVQTLKAQHEKSRLEKHAMYPDRNGGTPVPANRAEWGMAYAQYAPVEFTAGPVVDNWNEHHGQGPKGWAGPPTANLQPQPFESFMGKIETADYDGDVRPLNPMGRTGISGRGLLGKWGANFAGDPIVTRNNPKTGELEMACIKRKDSGEWAIPGGMVDKGEDIFETLAREFEEEAGAKLDFSGAAEIYVGYADDPRNTDNAWMETQVRHMHLPDALGAKIELQAGDDAAAVRWTPMNAKNIDNLYGNHAAFVKLALERLPSE